MAWPSLTGDTKSRRYLDADYADSAEFFCHKNAQKATEFLDTDSPREIGKAAI
jgi:hypothetical protein